MQLQAGTGRSSSIIPPKLQKMLIECHSHLLFLFLKVLMQLTPKIDWNKDDFLITKWVDKQSCNTDESGHRYNNQSKHDDNGKQ